MTDERKPVLWVSLTSAGRGDTDTETMDSLAARLEDEIGEEYNIVVADDRVRLATVEDLQDLKHSLDSLLPSDLETEAEKAERQREELGMNAEDLMGDGEDAVGVQDPAGEGDDEQ